MEKEIITLSSSTSNINDSIVISSTGGVDIDYTTLTWKKQGSIQETTISRGEFKFDAETFEPLFTTASDVANGIDIVFTLTSHGVEDGSEVVDYSTATCNLSITDAFIPHVYVTSVESQPLYNGHLRAGSTATSTVEITIDNPGTKSCTITVSNVVSDAPVTYTATTSDIVFNLPEINQELYTVSFRITVTDSRGMSSYTDVDTKTIGDVYCYNAPGLTLTEYYRCDEDGVETANGTYVLFKGTLVDTESTKYAFDAVINEISKPITAVNNQWQIVMGDDELDVSNDYTFGIYYTNVYMHQKSYNAIAVQGKLLAQKVPVSFIDDGVVKGVSVGEMAQNYDETTSETVFNYGNEAEIRARQGDQVVVETAYNVINAHKYITETVLGELRFVALSEYDYNNLRNKDSNTIYFVY